MSLRTALFILISAVQAFNGLCLQFKSYEGFHPTSLAVLVDTSMHWFNYRHMVNVLAIHELLRDEFSFCPSRLTLMLAEDFSCNDRNPIKPFMVNDGRGVEMKRLDTDYRLTLHGNDLTVQNFLDFLVNIQSTKETRIFLYMTGHGGDEFLKFRDKEEINSGDLNRVFTMMHSLRKYRELLVIIDTCQAFTLCNAITAPNVVCIGSSLKDENSYSHHAETEVLGVAIIDRFTHYMIQKLKKLDLAKNYSIAEFVESFDPQLLRSHVSVSSTINRNLSSVYLQDFLK